MTNETTSEARSEGHELSVSARAEAQRILDGAARRLLAEELKAKERGLPTPLLDREMRKRQRRDRGA
jgi:hypothetical protein